MSDKKNNGYVNIDDDSFLKSSNPMANDGLKEQHTLDFYNDDMSRKAVKNMFEINNELSQDQKVQQKKTLGYSATNKNTVANTPEQKPQATDKNGNPEYTYQSFDYDKLNNEAKQGYRYGSSKKPIDYTNTSFSVEKLEAERKAREEVEKNKEILKQLENNERPRNNMQYKTVGEVQESYDKEAYDTIPIRKVKSQVNNKRKQIMTIRIITFAIILLLIVSFVSTILINISLKTKVSELEATVSTLSEENKQVQTLQNEVNILSDELAKTKTDASETTNTDTDTNTTPEVETENNNSTEEYTVKSGDSLSSISRQFYGDPNRYTEIVEANNLTSTSLYSGQKLIIP